MQTLAVFQPYSGIKKLIFVGQFTCIITKESSIDYLVRR
jgi:hypothetical protein